MQVQLKDSHKRKGNERKQKERKEKEEIMYNLFGVGLQAPVWKCKHRVSAGFIGNVKRDEISFKKKGNLYIHLICSSLVPC